MLSLRSLARAAPRNTSRLVAIARPARHTALSPAVWSKPAASLRIASAFSTSRPCFNGNEELAQKLNSEITIEKDQQEDDLRGNLKEYLDNSEFELEDVPGQEEVALTRTYGDEKIRVVFSIADFNTPEMESDVEAEDEALYDEDVPENTQTGGANTKGAVNQGRTKGGNIQVAPEDEIAPADREELRSDDEVQEPSFSARAQVHVTRGGKGAMTISCLVQDGELEIEDIYFFPKAEMAEAKTAEQDHQRRSLYTGPPFGQLDDDLQVLLENYLEERGINTAMALFIPDYIDMKEQKEYIRWLGNMKSFVE